MATIPSGSTLRRIRWSWGFSGITSDVVDVDSLTSNPLAVGIVTVIGNGSEIPPDVVPTAVDAAPPTQRFLWWELRQPVITAVSKEAGVMAWRDSGPQEVPDVQSQVLATGIPAGDNLDLWFRWSSVTGATWDASGGVELFIFASILYTSP